MAVKVFAKDLEGRVWWYAALGPLLLLLTLFVTTWCDRAPFLPLVSLLSLPLATLIGRKGLFIGCAFLLINWATEPTLWAMGATASAACALFVSHVGFGEVRHPFERFRKDHLDLEGEFAALRTEYLEYRHVTEHALRIEQVKIRELAALQEERNALLAELFELRCHPPAQPDRTSAQLRQQFEEKKELIHQTRDELFQMESRALRTEHEAANAGLEPDLHFNALAEPLQAAADAEQQIEELEQVIAKLLGELKSRSVPSLSGFQLPPQ